MRRDKRKSSETVEIACEREAQDKRTPFETAVSSTQ